MLYAIFGLRCFLAEDIIRIVPDAFPVAPGIFHQPLIHTHPYGLTLTVSMRQLVGENPGNLAPLPHARSVSYEETAPRSIRVYLLKTLPGINNGFKLSFRKLPGSDHFFGEPRLISRVRGFHRCHSCTLNEVCRMRLCTGNL